MKLKDKIAIVTGAGQGLGRAIALMLGEEGAVVAVVGRTTSKLESVAAEITQAGGRAWPITADLTEEDQVQGMVDQVMEKYGRIDILVNNAGFGISGAVEFTDLVTARRIYAKAKEMGIGLKVDM